MKEPNPFLLKNPAGTGSDITPIYYTRTDVLSGASPASLPAVFTHRKEAESAWRAHFQKDSVFRSILVLIVTTKALMHFDEVSIEAI